MKYIKFFLILIFGMIFINNGYSEILNSESTDGDIKIYSVLNNETIGTQFKSIYLTNQNCLVNFYSVQEGGFYKVKYDLIKNNNGNFVFNNKTVGHIAFDLSGSGYDTYISDIEGGLNSNKFGILIKRSGTDTSYKFFGIEVNNCNSILVHQNQSSFYSGIADGRLYYLSLIHI